MVQHAQRRIMLAVTALMVALVLAACGGAATPPAETPEDRVKSFFATFSDAINDPEISDAAKQAEWVDRLVAFAPPDDQAGARESIQTALSEFGSFNIAEMMGQPDLDVRMDVRFAITETQLVSEEGNRAVVEVVNGTITMQVVGDDVAALGDMATTFNQEVPISEFFSDSTQIELRLVDNVWYLVDALGGTGA